MNMLGIAMIVLIVSFVSMLFISMTMRNKRLVLVASVAILSVMNNSYITKITEPMGIGAPIILMLLVAICLILSFHINVFKIPSHNGGILGVFLALILTLSIISIPFSENVFRSIINVLMLAFVIVIGWIIFGKIYQKFPDQSRGILILITDIVGFLSLLSIILVIVFAGPTAWRGEVGGAGSIINLFGVTVSRLQAENFNATGIGAFSATAIFWLFNLLQRYEHNRNAIVLILFLVIISFLCLFWSGSRGPLAAFFATWITISMIASKNRKKLRNFIGLLVILCGSLYYLNNHFNGILYRGIDSDTTISLVDLFVASRLEIIGTNTQELLAPTLFGHGFGFSTGDGTEQYSIESFFIRIWVELGIIGSIIYFTTFILLTSYVVKVDKYFFIKGERGAFFPSAILIFTWMNSPTSFGFSLPVGGLAIQLAIASGALFMWRQIRISNLQIHLHEQSLSMSVQ